MLPRPSKVLLAISTTQSLSACWLYLGDIQFTTENWIFMFARQKHIHDHQT